MTDASSSAPRASGPHSSGDTSSFGFRDVDAKAKVGMVREVFDSVASNYDLMNDLMSGGVHRLWKDAAAAKLNPRPGETLLDVAGGTGDMARRYAKMARRAQERNGGQDASVIVLDYNAEMILAGVQKGGEPEMQWSVGDAMALPLPDASVDAYSISFGIRNVAHIDVALSEARRVLKPGGRFLCLEFSRPTSAALRRAYDAWSFNAIPAIGQWVAKDRDSYQYLVESIRRFPDQAAFKTMIEAAGFRNVAVTNLSGGGGGDPFRVGDLTPEANPNLYRVAPAAPVAIRVRDPIGAAWRLIGWAGVLARHDALAPREITPLLPAWARPIAHVLHMFAGREGRQGRPGQRLGKAFEHLGPVAIKLGQVLATRADIFGTEFATDLGRLKDALAPFPTDQARREIERSLGRPIDSLYTDFGDPIGAASLAQAHPAWLADGRKVAVKVLRPGVERRVAHGLDAMRLGARVVNRLVPAARRLEPAAFVETIARSMALELDMRLEAAAASEMRDIMQASAAEGSGHMTAPAVVWDGVGKRVLTLEWAQGLPMTDPLAAEQPGLDKNALADNIVRAFLSQALDHGAFHADLHEGNLFARAPAEVTAVDYGIVGRLGAGERRYLAEILWGFLTRDYPRIARVHFEAGYVPPHHSVEAFAQALRAVGEPVIGKSASSVSMGRLLGQLFEITALFDMHLRPELILLQKTMVSVEGVARRLNPDHDLWAASQPVVERWITRELGPKAQIRDGLRELIGGARALSRLVQEPPRPEPVVVTVVRTPRWLAACVVVATAASLGALVLSLWCVIAW